MNTKLYVVVKRPNRNKADKELVTAKVVLETEDFHFATRTQCKLNQKLWNEGEGNCICYMGESALKSGLRYCKVLP